MEYHTFAITKRLVSVWTVVSIIVADICLGTFADKGNGREISGLC